MSHNFKNFKVFIILLFSFLVIGSLTLNAQSQSELVGRIYSNSNIMKGQFKEIVSQISSKKDSLRLAAYQEERKKRGRELTEEEKQNVNKKIDEEMELLKHLETAMKVAIKVEFKSESDLIMYMKVTIDEEILKKAKVSWTKRKAIKAALALAPQKEKDTYIRQNNLIIVGKAKDTDTLKLSDDGKYIYGTFEKNKPFRLVRSQ